MYRFKACGMGQSRQRLMETFVDREPHVAASRSLNGKDALLEGELEQLGLGAGIGERPILAAAAFQAASSGPSLSPKPAGERRAPGQG
jgi:hypothetical protein